MTTKTKTTKMYDTNYFSERDYIPHHLINVLEIIFKKNKINTILEVGVGSGKLMKKLKEDGYTIKGIDISPVAAKLSGARVASATKIPFAKDKFDCVLAISIIEHLTEKEGKIFIKEANRVLKNKGILFIVTPNFSSPLRHIKKDKWFGYSDKTHVFFYTPNSLKKLLNINKFVNVNIAFKITSSSMEWPLPRLFHNSPKIIKYLINFLLVSTPLAYFRDSFWIEGQKSK